MGLCSSDEEKRPFTFVPGNLKNTAFVFVKPHAVTEDVKSLVKTTLEGKGLKVLTEGEIKSEEIDEKKLIDQHYYAIASKATILKPEQLNVPADKFKEQFGLEWEEALKNGNVYNAMDGCAKLDITPDELDTQWGICKKAKKLVSKFLDNLTTRTTPEGRKRQILCGLCPKRRSLQIAVLLSKQSVGILQIRCS